MADKKPWNHLEDAVQDLWTAFSKVSDETTITLFCKKYDDARISKSFLDKFILKVNDEVDAGNWDLADDPDYTIPKEWMKDLMKVAKKNLKKKASRKNKKLALVVREEIVIKEEDVVPVLTPEEIAKNRQSLLKKNEEKKKAQAITKKNRDELNKQKTHEQILDGMIQNMQHQLRGCGL